MATEINPLNMSHEQKVKWLLDKIDQGVPMPPAIVAMVSLEASLLKLT